MSNLTKQVIWITGLSGAGKSTLANELAGIIRKHGKPVILLDGDELRTIFRPSQSNPENYNKPSRISIAKQYAMLCKTIADQGITVIIATISLFSEIHTWNRKNLPGYYEVYLSVPLDELRRRDPKGIYNQFFAGEIKNVVGLDIPADEPRNADLVIKYEQNQLTKNIAHELFLELKKR